MAELPVTTLRPAAKREAPPLAFPGCRPVRVSRAEIADYERRIEYWDAATEVAMVCDPVSVYHEHPGQRLRELATRIALMRGSPIEAFGAADLPPHRSLMRGLRGLFGILTSVFTPSGPRRVGDGNSSPDPGACQEAPEGASFSVEKQTRTARPVRQLPAEVPELLSAIGRAGPWSTARAFSNAFSRASASVTMG